MKKLTLPTFFKAYILDLANKTEGERLDFIKDNSCYINSQSLNEEVRVNVGVPIREVTMPLSHALAIANILFEVKKIDKLLTRDVVELNRTNKDLNLLHIYASRGELHRIIEKGSIPAIIGIIGEGGIKIQNKTIQNWSSPLYSYLTHPSFAAHLINPTIIKTLKNKHWKEKNFEDFKKILCHMASEVNPSETTEIHNISQLDRK